MTEGRPPTRHEVTIHEAGHAVMARIVGAYVTHIEFAPDEPGEHDYLARYYARSHGTLAQTDWAAVAYAGFVAQRRVNPDSTLHGADADNFSECLKGASHATCGAVIVRVETMIAAHWDEIERLAAELVRCDGLYTRELEAHGYWWPVPVRKCLALSRALGCKPEVKKP